MASVNVDIPGGTVTIDRAAVLVIPDNTQDIHSFIEWFQKQPEVTPRHVSLAIESLQQSITLTHEFWTALNGGNYGVWIQEHSRSLQFLSRAQAAERNKQPARARSFYCKAAKCEVLSINAMPETELARNLSAAIVDAVSFYWKGHDFDSAAKLWDAWETSAHITDWAKTTVEKLLSGKEQT